MNTGDISQLIERLRRTVTLSREHPNSPLTLGSLAHAVTAAADALTSLTEDRDRLREALQFYMSQFGQGLEAHGISYSPAQLEADERARAALAPHGNCGEVG